MSLSSYVALSLKIDWNGDGDFTDPYDDVTAFALYPVTTSRGRASVNDEFGAGTGTFRLDNRDGRFSPFNASSPLYPYVLPGRPVEITATYNSTMYSIFRGRCTPVAQSARADEPYVEFQMVDAFEELRLGLTSTPLGVNQRVDEAISDILDNIAWASGRDLDESLTTLEYFTNFKRSPLTALQLAARQELGGRLFVSKDGSITFRNRYAVGEADVVTTISGGLDDVDPQVRQEDLVDSVRVTYPRFYATDYTNVFTLSGYLPVPANSTIDVEFLVDLQGAAGVKLYVTPLVAGTHFEANSQPDGSGTSKNAQITITIPNADTGLAMVLSAGEAAGETLHIVNTDSSTVYITSLTVEGVPIFRGDEVNAITKTVTAPIITGQVFSTDFEYVTDSVALDGWASYQANARGSIRARPTVRLSADTDQLMDVLLALELGDKLVLSDTGAPWLTQIDNTYVVEAIDFEVAGPRMVRSTLRLFDRELAGARFFKMSGAAGAGQDYSEIVSAVSTVGDGFAY